MMQANPTTGDAVALLRGGDRAYMADVDLPLARRIGAVCYVLTALALLVTVPFVPPTVLFGPAVGWGLSAALVALGLGGAAWALWAREVGLTALYAIDVALLLGLGAIGWLARNGDLYSTLPVLVLVLTSAIYPARLMALTLLLALAAQLPALLAVGADTNAVAVLLTHAFTWACLCTLGLLWTAGVRVQRRALHEHARIDALTGLGNRRAFEETAVVELARAARAGSALSLLVGDLDDFKEINDRHGHLVGDACLRAVAAVVRDLTRRPDSCFRWGGDEFVLLLPGADQARARAVADRLADAVGAACRAPDGRPLSLAFGVAERDDEGEAGGLLARADHDLLAAKVG